MRAPAAASAAAKHLQHACEDAAVNTLPDVNPVSWRGLLHHGLMIATWWLPAAPASPGPGWGLCPFHCCQATSIWCGVSRWRPVLSNLAVQDCLRMKPGPAVSNCTLLPFPPYPDPAAAAAVHVCHAAQLLPGSCS
jgi:hypothetical protein